MSEAVGGWLNVKTGNALCVHCYDDHAQGKHISLRKESLNPKLVCSECERSLLDALDSAPPPPKQEADSQGDLELEMPDVFGAEEAEKKSPKPQRVRKKRQTRKKKAADGDS